MAIDLYRIPGTQLFVNSPPGDMANRAMHASFCFFHKPATQLNTITFEASQAIDGAYAFLPPNAVSPFDAVERVMATAAQGKERLLLWMNENWNQALNELSVKNTVTLSLVELTYWKFDVLPEVGPGRAEISFRVPKGTIVAFDAGGISLSHSNLQMVARIEPNVPLELHPAGNAIRLVLESGVRCATFKGELSEQDTSKLIAVVTPQVRYRWKPSSLAKTKSARILSTQSADHKDVIAQFELSPFRLHRDHSRIRLSSTGASSQLISTLLDTTGQTVDLRPDKDAAIYFETSPRGGAYASLLGQFAVKSSTSANVAGVGPMFREIMPGSAGTEFFQLDKDGYNGLKFFPGQPAFVQFGSASQPPTISPDDLTTAWVAPCRTGEVTTFSTAGYSFVAQPQDQPLYGRREVANLNQVAHPSTIVFDPAPIHVDASLCLPFFPFRGIRKGTLADTHRLDKEALAPIRSEHAFKSSFRLNEKLDAFNGADLTWITTPQGLLVEIDSANNWHTIKLGESESGNWKLIIRRPNDINGRPVERWALQEAFSCSEVFMVITKQEKGDTPDTADPSFGTIDLVVNIGDWPMKVSFADTGSVKSKEEIPPVDDPSKKPVLIIKLSKGPLDVMLGDVGRWSLARIFNGDPQKASTGAVAALGNLEQLSRGISPLVKRDAQPKDKEIAPELIPYYKRIYNKIRSDDWTGVLILNAHTPFNEVPGEVAVVTEGKKVADKFGVPVLGIDVSRVMPQAGSMKLEKTSAFAAIHYHSPEPLSEDGDFDFKLRALNTIFENSELRTVLASMQLRLSEFFGTKSATKQSVGDTDTRLLDILGRYEKSKDDKYTFRALGRRSMRFEGNEFLNNLEITRIDVTSHRVNKDTVETRFGMWGVLGFGPKFSNITGIRKIEYENAALKMWKGNYQADLGNIRVDFKKGGDDSYDGQGLLAKFPFQLSAMRWSSLASPLSLPSIGFSGLSLPGYDGMAAPSFDIGLELDLNLGSMGKLVEAAEFLKAKILIGWYNVSNPLQGYCVGFRFEGGNGPLDIGVNGVLRLTADDVNLKSYHNPDPAGIGIGLLNPQLEVMGYKVPSEPKDTLVAFIPTGPDKNNVAWAWARCDTDVGPLKLGYFAMGQGISLVSEDALKPGSSLDDIIEDSKKHLQLSCTDKDKAAKLPDIGKLYTLEAGWGVLAYGSVKSFKFRLVFLDGLNRYGLGLDIPKIAKADVLYRKLSDGQGVFSAEINPEFRTFEMGVATVTLPVLGFDAVTNGDWAINIGYHGNDFSRGTTVQMLPLIGSGGMRFGKLDWRSSYVLNSPDSTNRKLIEILNLDPVIELSLAARVGVGKELTEGVFSAAITLSVYGIFEGALAIPNDPIDPAYPKFPDGVSRRYIKISGTAGLLLEIFGVANFSVISAAVSIRVWVEAGITFETWAPVLFHAEAGISVFVRFVVARFSVFGSTIEIAINFSFASRVRFTQKLTDSFDGSLPDVYIPYVRERIPAAMLAALDYDAVQPLEWDVHELVAAPEGLFAAVTVEPMISGQVPVVLPMLLASHVEGKTEGLGNFCVLLFEWALRLSLGLTPKDPTPARVEMSKLRVLIGQITPPIGINPKSGRRTKTSLARWGKKPLNFAAFQAFIEKHLRIELVDVLTMQSLQTELLEASGVQALDKPQGILLPWFADIAMWVSEHGKPDYVVRDFRGKSSSSVNETWETALFELLSESMLDYPPEDSMLLKLEYLESGYHVKTLESKEALDAITEDWAAALVQGITQRAIQEARSLTAEDAKTQSDPTVDLSKLLAALKTQGAGGSPCVQVAQHASTFLHHGLRVPSIDGTSCLALSEFLKSEIAISELIKLGKACSLSFSMRPGFAGSWITGRSTLHPFDSVAALSQLNIANEVLETSKVKLTVGLEESIGETTQPRRFVIDTFVPLGRQNDSAPSLHIASVPEALFALSQRHTPLLVVPKIENPDDPKQKKVLSPRWFIKIEVRLESSKTAKTKSVTRQRPVYSVLSVDPRIRDLLKAMHGPLGAGLITEARLAFPVETSGATAPFRFLEKNEAFLFVSNLSTEPAPPRAFGALHAPDAEPPTLATFNDSAAIAQILWMASTVNAPGFHLAFEVGDPIAHLFMKEAIASVSIIFELAPSVDFQPIIDGLLLDASLVQQGWIVSLTTPNLQELTTTTPDGQVAILVERDNPLFGIEQVMDPVKKDAPYLAARYELVDYWTKHNAANVDNTATVVIARDSVIPVRVHMDENCQEKAEKSTIEPASWLYRILVPLAKISQRTDERRASAAGIAAKEPNPYEFVGTNISSLIHVGLRDGAGHKLDDSKLEITWKGNERILYRDAIFRLEELPGITATWRVFKAAAKTPAVEVLMFWSAEQLFGTLSSKAIPAERQAALLEQYKRCVAMVLAPDFNAHIQVSIGGNLVAKLDVKQDILDWLTRITAELKNRTNKNCNCKPLTATINHASLPASTPLPVQLSTTILFKRDETLCDKRSTNEDVWTALSPIMPKNLQSASDWIVWSASVQKAFENTFSLLKHVDGQVEPSTTRPMGSTVWLMHRSMLAVSKLKANSAAFFAPSPLAKAFSSGAASVPLADGQTAIVEVKDIDLNAIANRASGVMESMLSSSVGEALCRIYPMLYPRLTRAKKGIADAMSARLKGIIEGQPDLKLNTQENFRNACREDTRVAFEPTAVVTVDLPSAIAWNSKTFLWGNVDVSSASSASPASRSVSFSTTRIPLGYAGPGGSFDFVIRWATPGVDPWAVIAGAMLFTPQYVEVQGDKDEAGYRPSDWYEVVWAGELGTGASMAVLPALGSEWQIPLPLRLVPPTPAILNHKAEQIVPLATEELGAYVGKARGWEYQLSVLVPGMDHDTADVIVRFGDTVTLTSLAADTLFEALVAFSHHESLIEKIIGDLALGAEIESTNVELAVKLFENIWTALTLQRATSTEAIEKWENAMCVEIQRNMTQPTTTGSQFISEISWDVDPPQYQRAVRVSLPLIFAVDNSDSQGVVDPYEFDLDKGLAKYKHSQNDDAGKALVGIANLSPRRLIFSALDVMVQGRASPTLMARRNARLLGTNTTISKSFIFETASVQAPNPLVPHLSHRDVYDISTGDTTVRSITYWLVRLRDEIFRDADCNRFSIDVSARLKLLLVKDGVPASSIYFYPPLPSLKGVSAGDKNDWIAALSGHLLTAIERIEPEARKDGYLELKVQVFAISGEDSKRPSLSLEGLYIPLAKISIDAALKEISMGSSSMRNTEVPQQLIAAYIYSQMLGLKGGQLQLRRAMDELALFAFSQDASLLSDVVLPSSSDLATPTGRSIWVESLNAVARASAATKTVSKYAALVIGPGDTSGKAPAPMIRHWAMTLDSTKVKRVAGPLVRDAFSPEGELNLYLWGLKR